MENGFSRIAVWMTCITFLSFITLASKIASAAPTDYDGAWLMDVHCSDSKIIPRDKSFTSKFSITISNGSFNFEQDGIYHGSYSSKASWTGSVNANDLNISAHVIGSALREHWDYEFHGKPTTPSQVLGSGGLYVYPNYGRTLSQQCNVEMSLSWPAPESLAAKERERQAKELEQASAAPQDPQSSKSPPRQPPHAAVATPVTKPATKPQQFVAAQAPSASQNSPASSSSPAPPANYAGSAGRLEQSPQADPVGGFRATAVQVALRDKFARRIGKDEADRLFIGNDGDLLLFSNDSPQAPHAARTLNGDLYFRDKKLVVCSIAKSLKIDGQFAQYATSALTKLLPDLEIQPANPWSTTCGWNSTFDIFAVLRSDLISYSDTQDVMEKGLSEKHYHWLGLIPRSPFDALVGQQVVTTQNSAAPFIPLVQPSNYPGSAVKLEQSQQADPTAGLRVT